MRRARIATIEFEEFERVELRVATILEARPLEKARKPAYALTLDFGEFGVRTSSAQLTALYSPDDLVGRQVLAVCNLAPRRVAGFESQCLTTGVPDSDGAVVLIGPDRPVPNGARLF